MDVFAGTTILELGAGAAGPVAMRYFADCGATVIRIESKARPDFLRTLKLTPGLEGGLDAAEHFAVLNVNKLSVALNMSTPEGVAVAKRLALWADAVAENFAPGAMKKWGLDYATLSKERPDLVMISTCLNGATGPHRNYPGFGGQGSALSGFNHLTGWPDREPAGRTVRSIVVAALLALLLVGAAKAQLPRTSTSRRRGRHLSHQRSPSRQRASATARATPRRTASSVVATPPTAANAGSRSRSTTTPTGRSSSP
jgi:benzylsuccinate CoA-transferase BbsF subunit